MAHVEHEGQKAWRTQRSGLQTRTIVSRECGARSVTVWEQQLQPGDRIPLHYHEFEETLTILEGELTADIGDRQVLARARSTFFVAPGVAHSLHNRGSVPALLLAHFINAEPTIIALPDLE